MKKLKILSFCPPNTAHKLEQWSIFCPVLAAGGEIDQDNLTF